VSLLTFMPGKMSYSRNAAERRPQLPLDHKTHGTFAEAALKLLILAIRNCRSSPAVAIERRAAIGNCRRVRRPLLHILNRLCLLYYRPEIEEQNPSTAQCPPRDGRHGLGRRDPIADLSSSPAFPNSAARTRCAYDL
jgi:hypothetical protein